MTDLDKMARELLAAEYDRAGSKRFAEDLRSDCHIGDRDIAHAVGAIRAALLIAPPGYALVPVELPVEMGVAFCEQWFSKRRAIDDPRMQDCWAATITAAPEPEA